VVTVPWAIFVLWAGTTRESGIDRMDLALAAGPLLIGWLLRTAGRFVVTGSVRRREIQ
jgi:ethanolamine utilization microcompartment shell protein EutS